MDRKRNRNQRVRKKQCRERPRWTDRRRDEGQCQGHRALTELSAGFLGPLRHLGKSCKAPGRRASGGTQQWTSTLRFLPHLPFPFLAPSRRSLPLCIFKPVKLPQLHPPHPLHRGRGPGPPPFQAPVGCLLGLGRGGRGQTTSPWDLEGLGRQTTGPGNGAHWVGAAGGGNLPTAVRGSGQRLQGCREPGLPTGQFVLSLSAWRKTGSSEACCG